ncbi:LysE family translocator [Acinetobacter bereziniae]|uniref:LysE family translocator n=1 Tax=Acinetobacter bereziniae TaxID=106648 RepID=UPI00148F11BF|nr:LysE family transporter [Acinetobacter bereziniae]MCV2441611.1 LysE family transporter [Acinetobacter bereziniae]MDV8155121.1 LysE family transporter [Acinetobacter bereziniae]
MNEMIAVILITCLAVISPGADFAIVTRNSYLYGRQIGLSTALGIAGGVWIHVAYSLLGLGFLKNHMPYLLQTIQYIGAGYLIYLGYKTFTQNKVQLNENGVGITAWQAFRHGFLTNSLNPKTTLFVVSLFAQLITTAGNSTLKLVSYGAFISISHFIWFALIALFCAHPTIRNKILDNEIIINRIIGVLLFILGCSLLFAKF